MFAALALVFVVFASRSASAEPLVCDAGDVRMGPNCVHVEMAVTTSGVPIVLSSVYRTVEGKKHYVWGQELGLIVESDSAHILVKVVGPSNTSYFTYRWLADKGRYEQP